MTTIRNASSLVSFFCALPPPFAVPSLPPSPLVVPLNPILGSINLLHEETDFYPGSGAGGDADDVENWPNIVNGS